ncbi:MAG: hypothetical protein V1492_00160 [Candidatus Micrarchaeota archaeon]
MKNEEKKKSEEKKPQEKPADTSVDAAVKEIEKNLFAIKFYPVAVDLDSKTEGMQNILKIYKEGNETVRQLLIFMLHEAVSQYYDFKTVHVYDYFKAKNPQEDPTKLRMDVYRSIFNYNTSLEGIIDMILLLGKMSDNDDAAKVLTYHYARTSSIETEAHVMLRNVILDSLGDSDSPYALTALLKYARYTDSERTLPRIQLAVDKWSRKLETLKMNEKRKQQLKHELDDVLIKEFGKTHYG